MSFTSSATSDDTTNSMFLGNWKIVECINISKYKNSSPAKIEGAIFTLEENGEVNWDLTTAILDEPKLEIDQHFPLFQCHYYEIIQSFIGHVSLQMNSPNGHIYEFWIDVQMTSDNILLTFDNWIILQCQLVKNIYKEIDMEFSLLTAFQDGFFSDQLLTTTAAAAGGNGKLVENSVIQKEFNVHSIILNLNNINPEQLSNLPADVLEIMLYFLYSTCLPTALTKPMVISCIQFGSFHSEFKENCRNYLQRILLQEKITVLINAIHSHIEQMTMTFQQNNLIPNKFNSTIKFILKQIVLIFIKLIELCVLYSEESKNLNHSEQLIILKYAKSKLLTFLKQSIDLLKCVKNEFCNLKIYERNDLVAVITPEIMDFLNVLCDLFNEMKDACNDIWTRWSKEINVDSTNLSYNPNNSTNYGYYWQDCQPLLLLESNNSSSSNNSTPSEENENLADCLWSIFRKREIMKLYNINSQIAAIYLYLVQKRENFDGMTTGMKIRCVSYNFEQLLEELPIFLLKLEEIMTTFDDQFEWKNFKFCLQLGISQIYQTIQHLVKESERLQKFFTILTDLIQCDDFYQSLVNLKLVKTTTVQNSGEDENDGKAYTSSKEETDSGVDCRNKTEIDELLSQLQNSNVPEQPDDNFNIFSINEQYFSLRRHAENDLNLLRDLCTPKKSNENILAKNCAKLFNSTEFSDMVFEIVQDDKTNLTIPAHRCIVASRCDWFRRALLSGMKESIQKKITIHDCSANIFQLFLKYIYIGKLTEDSEESEDDEQLLVLDILIELITLADRYELDSLKSICEHEIIHKHLEENNIIYLLSLADQYNINNLRSSCLEYISTNPGIICKDVFEQLSPELQMEVYDITMWSKSTSKQQSSSHVSIGK